MTDGSTYNALSYVCETSSFSLRQNCCVRYSSHCLSLFSVTPTVWSDTNDAQQTNTLEVADLWKQAAGKKKPILGIMTRLYIQR
jgi:hypothetical protein